MKKIRRSWKISNKYFKVKRSIERALNIKRTDLKKYKDMYSSSDKRAHNMYEKIRRNNEKKTKKN